MTRKEYISNFKKLKMFATFVTKGQIDKLTADINGTMEIDPELATLVATTMNNVLELKKLVEKRALELKGEL